MNRGIISKGNFKSEDKILIASVLDKYSLFEKTGIATNSNFLDPYQRVAVERIFKANGIRDHSFYGGFPCAERTIVFFSPDNVPKNELFYFPDVLRFLCIKPKTRCYLSHRDYLGSLMGLGIKREKIGDILVEDDFSHVVVLEDIVDYIKYNLEKVGNSRIEIQEVPADKISLPKPKMKEIASTVASLRLDSIAGVGFNMSRSKIAKFIKSEKVYLNWEMVSNVAKPVTEGDIISIRGKGRVILKSVGRTTRKERIHILLKKFI
ncbi:MAG: RNA-binding protein [Clostridium sp.]|nr:RNA-binding protein [Clostridium sp.]